MLPGATRAGGVGHGDGRVLARHVADGGGAVADALAVGRANVDGAAVGGSPEVGEGSPGQAEGL